MYLIKVHVQLPDGSFAYLPVAKYVDGPASQSIQSKELVKHETREDARQWAEFIIHDRVRIEEEK